MTNIFNTVRRNFQCSNARSNATALGRDWLRRAVLGCGTSPKESPLSCSWLGCSGKAHPAVPGWSICSMKVHAPAISVGREEIWGGWGSIAERVSD